MPTNTLKAKKAIGTSLAKKKTQAFVRPKFSKAKQMAARLEATLATGTDYSNVDLSKADLAAPHRAPYARIRDSILHDPAGKVSKMVKGLCRASKHCEGAFKKIGGSSSASASQFKTLAGLYKKTRRNVKKALSGYKKVMNAKNPDQNKIQRRKKSLVQAVNNLASNAPGLGPHSKTNAPVSDNLHTHSTGDAKKPYTPRTVAAIGNFPSTPIATTTQNTQAGQVVSVDGSLHTMAIGTNPTKNVNVGSVIFRGALYVDGQRNVYKPKSLNQAPTGVLSNDWDQIT